MFGTFVMLFHDTGMLFIMETLEDFEIFFVLSYNIIIACLHYAYI